MVSFLVLGLIGKLYFSDLHMIVEVKPEGTCADDQRIAERKEEGFRVELQDQKLTRKAGKKSVEFYALNMVLQKTNFDTARYSFSILDGVVPSIAPHGLRVRRRPGNFLEVTYLDQTFRLQLAKAPVYSFSATEKRGSCTLTHSINIFSENEGFYEAFDP